MAFKAEFEQFEFDFDEEYAQWTPKDGENFALTARDGSGIVYLSLSRDQAQELHDLIGGEIAKFDAYDGPFHQVPEAAPVEAVEPEEIEAPA